MYDSVFSKVKTIVGKCILNCNIAFTTDVWSDTSAGVSLLNLTAHAITEMLERVNFMLSAEPLEERHTGEYISKKFDEMLSKWDIPSNSVHCVLRDAGANMKNALFLSDLNNIDCTVHKIQLVVRNGLASKNEIG